VARSPNNPVPGVRTSNLLREVAFNWKEVADHLEEVGTKESFEYSLKLCRAGLMAGPSSGFALAGLLHFLSRQKSAGTLDHLKNKDGELVAVFICPDSPFPYLNEYFEYLNDSYFPTIENEGLLQQSSSVANLKADIPPVENELEFELTPQEAYSRLYLLDAEELWQRMQRKKKIDLSAGVKIIDLRSRDDFDHFHLPGSEWKDFYEVINPTAQMIAQLKKQKVFLVCTMGNRTGIAARILRKKGVSAYSIKGGMTEWSRLNFPRWRPEICRT